MLPLFPSAAGVARRVRPSLIAKPAAIAAASASPRPAPASAAASPSRCRSRGPSSRTKASARIKSTDDFWKQLTDDELFKQLQQQAEDDRRGALVDVEAIRDSLRHRPRRATYDFLTPTHSHLLNLGLWNALPPDARAGGIPSRQDVGKYGDRFMLPTLANRDGTPVLPHAHHLVYFPLQRPPELLLPDGTDPTTSPGAPFLRRMWAGGLVRFKYPARMKLDGRRVVCVERVDADTMRVRGPVGQERVFVDVWRRYGPIEDIDVQSFGARAMKDIEVAVEADPAIEERRTLVFLRAKDDVPDDWAAKEMAEERARLAMESPTRIVRAPYDPEYSFTVTPTPSMLFQFSALTYNAHSIHFDPQYCREVEGHRGLLVHGPLSLVLMLSAVRAKVTQMLAERATPEPFGPRSILSFEYRNAAPLYAGEELRVCLRQNKKERVGRDGQYLKWDVWVENSEGGLSVKGTAITRGKPLKGDGEDEPDDFEAAFGAAFGAT